MANTYILVGTSSSGTRTKWTASFWVKRSNLSNNNIIFGSYLDSSNNDVIRFNSVTGELQFWSYQAASFSNGGYLKTNRLFRDTNAWYHIVCRWDSNNSTADDRMKIWVNGVEETSFSSRTNPTSGRESLINYQGYTSIGRLGSDYLDGVLSHVHFCDNQLYQASDFGEYDSNGVWKIKTSPSVSYGTTGYFILKDGNSLTDQSGNGNDFSLQGGTLTNTEDNPSNVFCTVDPLTNPSVSYSNGNLTITGGDDVLSTIGVTSGKWYWESKAIPNGTGIHFGIAGTTNSSGSGSQIYTGTNTNSSYIWLRNSDISVRNGTGISNCNVTDNHSATNNNDIIGIALDLDSATKKVTFYKNGSDVGNVTFDYDNSIFIFPFFRMNTGATSNINFGNGYFGTTAVSSAGTNASGIGIFEYDVPTGYTALSTKGLNL